MPLKFILPTLLCAWMPIKEPAEKNVQKIKNDVFSLTDAYELGEQQVVYLDSFANKLSREETKVSNMRPNRYRTAYSDQQHVDKPAANSEYSYDVELSYNENDVDPDYPEESPADCKKNFISKRNNSSFFVCIICSFKCFPLILS